MGKVLSTILQGGLQKQVIADDDLIFWQHDVNVAIPNATWTPLPWNRAVTTLGEDVPSKRWGVFARPTDVVPSPGVANFAATTIAAGSDAAALPQGTINVVSTNADPVTGTPAFATAGYLVIRATTLGGADTVVKYTGKTATSFTGCTLGTGTMNTGNIVRQANVTFEKVGSGLAAIAEVAWANNATGLRGIRFRFMDGVFNFAAGTTVVGAVAAADPLMHIQTCEQPINGGQIPGPNVGGIVEVYQSSTGVLNSVFLATELSAPRLVAVDFCPVDISNVP